MKNLFKLASKKQQKAWLAMTLTAVLTMSFMLINISSTKAAVDGGTSSGIQLLDTDANGLIDRIAFNVLNTSGDQWGFTGSSPYGLSVTQGGNDITISTVAISGSDTADPVVIHVDLDESDLDLVNDTNGVTSNAIELIYTAGGGSTINDSDEELNGIATGDTGATDTEADAAAPVINDLSYEDNNGDGYIDQFSVGFSEVVDAASNLSANDLTFSSVGDFTGAAFGTNSTDLLTLGTETGVIVVLGTAATVMDTNDGSGLSIDTQTSFSLTDGTNVNNALGTQTQAFIGDGAAPVAMGGGVYLDSDENGQIDEVNFGFTEDVSYTYNDGDWSATANGLTGFDVTGCVGGGCTTVDVLEFTATADAGITGVSGGTEPDLQFTPGNNITDGDGHNAIGFTITGLFDSAAPVALSSEYLDTNGDGQVDRADVTFSEYITLTAYADADWTMGAGTVNLGNETNAAVESGNGNSAVLQISTTGDADTTGGSTAPTYAYTNNSNNLNDGNGNDTSSISATNIDDGASPIITGGEYDDTDSDGQVDQVRFYTTLDAGLACTGFTATTDFTVGTAGTVNLAENAGDSCSVNDPDELVIDLGTLGTADTTGGATDPVATYTQSGDVFEDGAGNDVPTAAGITLWDGAAPVELSSVYLDTNGDGQVDRADVTFSENITLTAYADADWTMGAGTVNLGNETNAAVESGNGNSAVLQITTTGDADVTGGLTAPTYAYTNNSDNLNDGNGNNTVSISATNMDDGAAPVIIDGEYRDSNADGQVDQAVLFTSEDAGLACTLFQGGTDFTVDTAGTVVLAENGTDSCSTSDPDEIIIDLGTLGAVDTTGGTDPTATYTQPTNGLEDGAGNDVPTASTVTIYDGAAPIMTDSQYEDLDGDGTVDSIGMMFSENLDDDIAVVDMASSDFTVTINNDGTGLVETLDLTGADDDALAVDFTGGTANATNADYEIAIAADKVGDAEGNLMGALSATNSDDLTSPIILDLEFFDTDDDGMIDRVDYTWSENVDTDDGSAPLGSDLGSLTLPDGSGATFGSATIGDPAGTSDTVSVTGITGQISEATETDSFDLTGITTQWADAFGNTTTDPDESFTITDSAAPYIEVVDIDVASATDFKVGDTITAIITTDYDGYTVDTVQVNGKDWDGFLDNTDDTYTATFVVDEGDTDRASVGDIPISISLSDGTNVNTAFTDAPDALFAVTIDANSPVAGTPTPAVYDPLDATLILVTSGASDSANGDFVDVTKIQFTDTNSTLNGANATYDLTDSTGVLTDATTITVDLSATDEAAVSSAGADWTGVGVTLSNGLLEDDHGNVSADGASVISAANTTIGIAPVISGTELADGDFGVGDGVGVIITADRDGYTQGTITINGQAMGSFADEGDNTYTGTYTVQEGDANRAAVGDIPISVQLVNAETSDTDTGPATSAGATTIDGNSPTAGTIASAIYNPSNGIVTLTTDAATIIGEDMDVTKVQFTDTNNTLNTNQATYDLIGSVGTLTNGTTFTITLDGTDKAAIDTASGDWSGVGITTSNGILVDAHLNISADGAAVLPPAAVTIYEAPEITDVAIDADDYIIGDTATVTITSDGVGYTAAGIVINGQAATGFTDNLDNTYTVTYTVVDGDADADAAGDVPISVALSNNGVITNPAYTTAPTSPGTVTIDANAALIADELVAGDNSYIDVFFTEEVVNTDTGAGALEDTDFTLIFTQNGGTATGAVIASVSNTSNAALAGGEETIRIVLTVTGTPDGAELIEVKANATSIYDLAGNDTPAISSTGQVSLLPQPDPPADDETDFNGATTINDPATELADHITYEGASTDAIDTLDVVNTVEFTDDTNGDIVITLPAGLEITAVDTSDVATTFDSSVLEADEPTVTVNDLGATVADSIKGTASFGEAGKRLWFSRPVKVEIPVPGYTDTLINVKIKHEGGAWITTGLTATATDTCTNGVPGSPSAFATVAAGIATIYTCSASEFAAYEPYTAPAGGGGGGGSRYPSESNYALPATESSTPVTISDRELELDQSEGLFTREVTMGNSYVGISMEFPQGTVATDSSGDPFTGNIPVPTKILESMLPDDIPGNDDFVTGFSVSVGEPVSFSTKIKVTITLPEDYEGRNNLIVYYYNETTGEYEQIAASDIELSSDGKSLIVYVDHFSKFVIADGGTGAATYETATAVVGTFGDTGGHWADSFIAELKNKGCTNGYNNGTVFMPDNTITRAEFVKLMACMYDIDVEDSVSTKPFPDVATTMWYAPYISKAKELGWVNGSGDGMFNPNSQIKRIEALKILVEASEITTPDPSEVNVTFNDVMSGEWYFKYIAWSVTVENEDIMNGYQDGTFKPNNNITRAESAKIINKIYDYAN